MVQENNVHGLEDSNGDVLAIGAITDGEYLKRSGGNITSGVPAGGGGASNFFRATKNDAAVITKNVWNHIKYDDEVFDTGGDYDAVNCKFVAPATGKYLFEATASILCSNAVILISIWINGVESSEGNRVAAGGSANAANVVAIENLTVGDEVVAKVYLSAVTNGTVEVSAVRNHFSGCKIA